MKKRSNIKNNTSLRLGIIILALGLVLPFCGKGFAFNNEKVLNPFEGKSYPTDEELRSLAVEEGLIPSKTDKDYIDQEVKDKNTILFWIVMPRAEKIGLINGLKNAFKEGSGVVIRQRAVYYVDEINAMLYNSIQNGDIKSMGPKGLGVIFKTLAIMDGDFDNGEDKVKLLKEYAGDEHLKLYKEEFPEKYDELLKKRQEAIEKLESK